MRFNEGEMLDLSQFTTDTLSTTSVWFLPDFTEAVHVLFTNATNPQGQNFVKMAVCQRTLQKPTNVAKAKGIEF